MAQRVSTFAARPVRLWSAICNVSIPRRCPGRTGVLARDTADATLSRTTRIHAVHDFRGSVLMNPPGPERLSCASRSGPGGFMRTLPRKSWTAWIRVVRDSVASAVSRARTPVRPGQRLGMLTLQIADQSLTGLAAKVETRWAIYPRDPNQPTHGVGDLQDPSR